jgi:hypothetical protein
MAKSVGELMRSSSMRLERKLRFLLCTSSYYVPLISTNEVLIDTVDAREQHDDDDEPQPINVTPAIPEVIEVVDTPIAEIPVRRSERSRKSAISDDYMVYLSQHEFDI